MYIMLNYVGDEMRFIFHDLSMIGDCKIDKVVARY